MAEMARATERETNRQLNPRVRSPNHCDPATDSGQLAERNPKHDSTLTSRIHSIAGFDD